MSLFLYLYSTLLKPNLKLISYLKALRIIFYVGTYTYINSKIQNYQDKFLISTFTFRFIKKAIKFLSLPSNSYFKKVIKPNFISKYYILFRKVWMLGIWKKYLHYFVSIKI